MTRQFGRMLALLLFAAATTAGCNLQRSETAPEHWYEVAGGTWQPAGELLAEIAGAIPAEAARANRYGQVPPAATYTIQYQGQVQEGRRLVRLAGICGTADRTAGRLKAAFLVVFDGGNCYFDAMYDPKLRRFMEFSFHGEA